MSERPAWERGNYYSKERELMSHASYYYYRLTRSDTNSLQINKLVSFESYALLLLHRGVVYENHSQILMTAESQVLPIKVNAWLTYLIGHASFPLSLPYKRIDAHTHTLAHIMVTFCISTNLPLSTLILSTIIYNHTSFPLSLLYHVHNQCSYNS